MIRPSILADLKYVLNLKRIIRSNRDFFLRFYFGRYLPERIRALSASGDWMKKAERLKEAFEVKANLLESIAEASTLARKKIHSSLIEAMAVRALQREACRYAAVELTHPGLMG